MDSVTKTILNRDTLDIVRSAMDEALKDYKAYMDQNKDKAFEDPFIKGFRDGYLEGTNHAISLVLKLKENSWKKEPVDVAALAEEALND